MLGLRFCARAFSSCGKWGPLFIAVRGPLTIAASLVGSTGSRRAGSVVVVHGPSCSAACGILPDQGSNPCPLHWQADPQPLRHQGSPLFFFLNNCFCFYNLFYLFIYLFLAALGLCCGAWAPHCGGFSCCGAQALGARASVVAVRGLSSCGSRALERRLSSCGARA